jgi:hypothetical protein
VNFIIEVSTTEPCLCNPDLNRSKFRSIFTKLCLRFVYNVVIIDCLAQEKFDDHSLIILHLKHFLKGVSATKSEDNSGINRMLEINLIYFTFRRVHILEINFRDMRIPELNAGGWRI